MNLPAAVDVLAALRRRREQVVALAAILEFHLRARRPEDQNRVMRALDHARELPLDEVLGEAGDRMDDTIAGEVRAIVVVGQA